MTEGLRPLSPEDWNAFLFGVLNSVVEDRGVAGYDKGVAEITLQHLGSRDKVTIRSFLAAPKNDDNYPEYFSLVPREMWETPIILLQFLPYSHDVDDGVPRSPYGPLKRTNFLGADGKLYTSEWVYLFSRNGSGGYVCWIDGQKEDERLEDWLEMLHLTIDDLLVVDFVPEGQTWHKPFDSGDYLRLGAFIMGMSVNEWQVVTDGRHPYFAFPIANN